MESKIEIKNQIDKYRKLLQLAETIEKDEQFINVYKHHDATLTEIENALIISDFDSLFKIVKSEARNYGWSFLPNEHGENVESAFWQLKKMIIPEE